MPVCNFRSGAISKTLTSSKIFTFQKITHLLMYEQDILCEISKVLFEIPHKISYPYIERYDFYTISKLYVLLCVFETPFRGQTRIISGCSCDPIQQQWLGLCPLLAISGELPWCHPFKASHYNPHWGSGTLRLNPWVSVLQVSCCNLTTMLYHHGPLLPRWINLNPNMDTWLHPL